MGETLNNSAAPRVDPLVIESNRFIDIAEKHILKLETECTQLRTEVARLTACLRIVSLCLVIICCVSVVAVLIAVYHYSAGPVVSTASVSGE